MVAGRHGAVYVVRQGVLQSCLRSPLAQSLLAALQCRFCAMHGDRLIAGPPGPGRACSMAASRALQTSSWE